MLGGEARDARRTERYLDGLLSADERRASDIPVDVETDPAVAMAARELRAGLTRVHPSFRFEEALAGRLAAGAARLRAGLPVEDRAAEGSRGGLTQFPIGGATAPGAAGIATGGATAGIGADLAPSPPAAAAGSSTGHIPSFWPAAALHRLPDMTAHPSRPLIVGGVGVGVASAAISLGAVYVAWRHSHTSSTRMGRAVRAAHGRTTHPGRPRRTGVINGILGVMS